MTTRKKQFNDLKIKLEAVGFVFEREQRPHRQKRKESELVFNHPELINKLESDGYKVNSKKFYIKPLSDEPDCEIGLVTGKSSPLFKIKEFYPPNTNDSFDGSPAWTNKENNNAIENFLEDINNYLNISSEKIPNRSKTFLFAWNPTKWKWTNLDESIENLKNVDYTERRWSCGNTKNIRKGDRIFLVRLGEEPKGIMGSGYAKTSHYSAPHWDGSPDKYCNYINIEFDVLINPEKNEIFDKEKIEKLDPNQIQQWYPQQSGISIKPEIVESLESSWLEFINQHKEIQKLFLSDNDSTDLRESFIEGKSMEVVQTRYERNPQARKRCLSHHGYSCKICDFNFEDHFGEIGRGFIHVHHINPISTIKEQYSVDPINDLIPVCPNCHAMIHSKNPAFTIEEIINIRK